MSETTEKSTACAKKLTARQDLFCVEYVKDRNGKQAAIRAGFSAKTAASIASRLLTQVNVQIRLESLGEKILAAHEVDAAYVIKGFKGLADDVGVDPKVRALCYEKLGDHLGMFVKRVEKSGPSGGPIQKQKVAEEPIDLEKLTDDELERMANGGDPKPAQE